MRKALKQLGYNETYHMMTVWENPRDAEMWIEAYDAKYFGKGKPFQREDWDQLLGHCQVMFPPRKPPPPISPFLFPRPNDNRPTTTRPHNPHYPQP